MSEIPKVLVLGPITPSPASARAEKLEYNNLEPAVEAAEPFERQRSARFWNAKDGSLEEQEAAEQLAQEYLLAGSLALQKATLPEDKRLWSDRYTKATSELYGTPDADTAHRLEQGDTTQSFEKAATELRTYLDNTYAHVFEAIQPDSEVTELTPSMIADQFEKGIAVLAKEYDPDWSDWTVDRNEEKDSLSVISRDKQIVVGMKRAAMAPEQLKSLFAHEVLVHAQRGLNGAKRSEELQTGLPGYLDVEEGLGVFFEYALTGTIPEKNIDRYTDIAYALGQLDGEQHTRRELLDRAMKRAVLRNQQTENPKSQDTIEKEVYAHVNRIYRGSLGDENIGIFTKDIVYHQGFLQAGNYIQHELESGKSVGDIMQYLLQGKFNPTNKAHSQLIAQLEEK